jgi:hypothetical protein
MSAPEIPSLRRRPIPGMSANPTPPPDSTLEQPDAAGTPTPGEPQAHPVAQDSTDSQVSDQGPERSAQGRRSGAQASGARQQRRPASDYAATRLVNFRLPVDLHDRFKRLVREAEQQHPRLRNPSLTELIIAVLEEGPGTADEVAEAIWRKRAAEHGGELSR